MTDQHNPHPDNEPSTPTWPGMDDDALHAAVDLIGRAGAKELNFGYLHDDVPMEQAAWWAAATYEGAKIMVEDHADPISAVEGLARKLLTGAKCVMCEGLITLSDSGAVAHPGTVMSDGTRLTHEDIQRAPRCRWRRIGPRWEQGCPTSHPPEPGDTVHTTEKLALALEELNDDRLSSIIRKARAGYYHDFLSPLATPELQLVATMEQVGHHEFARRVKAGEFDASAAESKAWHDSPEGRAAVEEFMPGGVPIPGSPFAHAIDAIFGPNASSAGPHENRQTRRKNRQKKGKKPSR